MNKKLLMGIIAGIGVVALVLGLVLGLNNCAGTTDPTGSTEPTPSDSVASTDPTEKPTKPPKETEDPTDPPEPGGISYYSGMPDYSWYDEDEIYEEYTLYTADQFMAFVELVNGMGVKFKDVTIKLGANFVFNKGDASKWTRDDEELLNWTPIGSKAENYFAGNIDGQGYYISGLYSVRARDNGFILYCQKSTIQNLAIVNSYFCNTGGDQAKAQVLGTFVGRGYGVTLKNLYTDAILEGGGYHTGGIVAFARDTWTLNKLEDAKDVLIDSCVFAGTIKGCVGVNVGGILGGTDGVNVKLISNCLNLGAIESSKASVGGIAGAISKETVMTNCVNAGKVVSEDKNCDRAALVGNASSSATVKDCYFANIPGAKPFGSGSPASSGIVGVDRASMKGGNAAKNLPALDFDKTWTAYKDGYAIPTGVINMYDALKKTVEEDAGNGGSLYVNQTGSTDTGEADTSWYKEGEKTFTLTTADQLYGLAQLVNEGKTTFEGVTIKLGADIVVNSGDASKWDAETTGLRAWKSIGTSSSKHFAGTLDGQGHYISGLYVRADRDSGFICYAMNATVKNLGIVNSYFENYGRTHSQGYLSAQVLGTFVGRSYGSTLQNLYSDARLVIPAEAQGFNTGGIAGFAKSNGTEGEVAYGASLIEGCVFAGTITTNNEKDELTGGILGSTDSSYTVIKNCLNRGQISSKGQTYGGIAGKLTKESVMEDCVNVGNVGNNVGLVGSVASTVTVSDCYYVKVTGGKAYGSGTPKTNKVTALTRDQMKGLEVGTAMSGLDFKSAWTALKDDYPIPTGVKELYAAHKQPIPGGESDESESGGESGGESGSTHVPGTPDTTWYEDGKTTFTLTTADQLYGLAQLVNEGNTFQGVTIKLGADIVINEGDASTWTKETTGLRAWTPIGLWSSSYFSGTLDGQGHYISGLYSVRGRDNGFMAYTINATIENLAIINSYFENTGTNNSAQVLGAFVGRGYGITLKNLYTNAIVVSSAKDYHTGGVIGFTQSNGTQNDISFQAATIEGVVFAGSIKSTEGEALERVGGILGGTDKGSVTIKNCLFVGTIDANDNYVGGIVGAVNGDSVITDCVSAGIINKAEGKTVGAIVGRLNGTGSFTVTDCYYTEGLNLDLYGVKANSSASVTATGNKELAVGKMVGLAVKDVMSGLDFTSAWTAQENDYPVPSGVLEMYLANKKPHVHDWADAWTSDENGHWHACGNVGCDVGKNDYSEHVYDVDNNKDSDCNICGYVRALPDANDGAANPEKSVYSGYAGGDNSWYQPDSGITEYVLDDADQLYGLAYLVNVKGVTFEGITIKLGINMVINEGDASTWGTTPPANEWRPIGINWTNCFKGTIDGQGHYISGLYSKNPGYSTFIAYTQGATVKNLAIINSYFENTDTTTNNKGEILSTFVGKGRGTYCINLYSDAILVGGTDQIGGIASYIQGAGGSQRDGKVENCVFAGTINAGSSVGKNVGGILGSDNNAGNRTVIRNCLFIGTINSQATKVGGIVGMAQEACVIDNCVSAGKVTVTGNNASYTDSNVVGFLNGDNAEITNCYYPEGTKIVGDENGKTYKSDGSEAQTDAKMKGLQVRDTMANLNFGENGWTAQEGDYPVPTSMQIVVNALRKHTADAADPVIITQPTMDNLTVHAESVDGGALTYQWFMRTDGTDFAAIEGATGASYSHDSNITGNVWYYCEVTNTNNNTSGAKTAKVVSVTVMVHTHVYDTTMTHNSEGHWYACTVDGCDVDVTDLPTYEAHDYDDDQDTTCNVTECGYERHVHNWKTEWEITDTHGWHECDSTDCDVTKTEDKGGYHAHSFDTTGTFPVCVTCPYERLISYYSGTPDTEWYENNKDADEYILTSADQLYGLAKLVNSGTTFKDKTIRLAVNMVINEGDASDWSSDTTGLYSWTPIGDSYVSSTNAADHATKPNVENWSMRGYFSGRLEGDGHYISGLYSVKKRENAFMLYSFDASVRNLAIVNSYFESTGSVNYAGSANYLDTQILASFVGRGYGITLENLYTDAILVSSNKDYHTGGICGFAKSSGKQGSIVYENISTIDSCVFAGTIITNKSEQNGSLIGGILGGTDGSYATIKNCLFSGSIVSNDNLVGGIVGRIYAGSEVSGCLTGGTIAKTAGSNNGAIIGDCNNGGEYEIANNYFSESLNFDAIAKYHASAKYTGSDESVDNTGNSVSVSRINLLGEGAKDYLPNLDFTSDDPKWTVMSGDYPVPTGVLKLVQAVRKVPGDANVPLINTQPDSFGYNAVGDDVTDLLIAATSTDGGKLSYQWYVNTILSNDGGTPIEGATEAKYSPSLSGLIAGQSKYYYCVVTNTNSAVEGETTASVASNVSVVHIHDAKASWKYDETNHWHECKVSGCSEKLETAAHDSSNANHVCQCGQVKVSYYNGVSDYAWYEENASTKTVTLTTASQLYGLADIVNGTNGATQDDLSGWVIKLGVNIVINSGEASEWSSTNEPAYSWTSIGINSNWKTKVFKGEFDGQGHYISGLYQVKSDNWGGGLFRDAHGALIHDLALINAYFENSVNITSSGNGGHIGSVVGRAWNTTLRNVYSDAIVKTATPERVGGLVGTVRDHSTGCSGSDCSANHKSSSILIENCVFAGQVIANGTSSESVGGILGRDNDGRAVIKNCLNLGSVYGETSNVGGILGYGNTDTQVENCLNVGTVTGGSNVGAVLGYASKAMTLDNCYYVEGSNAVAFNKGDVTVTGTGAASVAAADAQGTAALDSGKPLAGLATGWKATAGYPVPNPTATLVEEKEVFESATVPFTINGNHISKYTIVWGDSDLTALQTHAWYNEVADLDSTYAGRDNFKQWLTNEDGTVTEYNLETAQRLQAYIEEICSVELPIEQATASTAEYKILVDSVIGADPADVDDYEIYVDGNNLVIKGGSYGATWHALDYLESLDDLVLASDYKYSGGYDMITIGMMGDSITHGSNSSLYVYGQKIDGVSQVGKYTALAYPAQVGRLMWKEVVTYNYGRAGIQLVNYRNGSEWTALLADAADLDYVTIMLGANDSGPEGIMGDGVWSAEDEALFASEYKAIVETLQDKNADMKFVLATPPSCFQTGIRAVGRTYVVRAVETAYKELSKTHTMGIVDMYNLTADMKDYFTDNLHPNNEGYVKIANIFKDYLESVMLTNGMSTNDAKRPVLNVQPTDCGYNAGVSGTPLKVVATSCDGGVLSYQWYENATDSNVGGTLIEGATEATLTPDLSSLNAGEAKYFYCVVTNTNTEKSGVQTASVTSEPAEVHVHKLADTYTGHDATHHWAACTVTGCSAADAKEEHSGEGNTCTTCGFLKANYYAGGSDTSWYTSNPNATEYVLTTPAQLYGLAEIVNAGTDTFEGQTIKLGANMVINDGDASTWNASSGLTVWSPIGDGGKVSNVIHDVFSGTFDGQGHFISGVWCVKDRDNGFFNWTVDAVIKDFAIINSYFENKAAGNNGQGLATFVGRCLGTELRNLYTDAILVCNAQRFHSNVSNGSYDTPSSDYVTGGLVAFAYGSGTREGIAVAKNVMIENCVFAGTIDSDAYGAGRMVGGLVGFYNAGTVTIKNSQMAGTIISNDNFVGGIVGQANAGSGLTITQCLVSGRMKAVVYADTCGSAQDTNNDTDLSTWAGLVGWFGSDNSHVITNNYYHNKLINITDANAPAEKEMPACGTNKTSSGVADNTVLTDSMTATEILSGLGSAWEAGDGAYPVPKDVVIP